MRKTRIGKAGSAQNIGLRKKRKLVGHDLISVTLVVGVGEEFVLTIVIRLVNLEDGCVMGAIWL